MATELDKQWRLDSAAHLKSARLELRPYSRWSDSRDHDHCAACGAKLAEFDGPDILHRGYSTGSDYPLGACYEWVCEPCFEDLKSDMGWSTVVP